MSKILSYIAPDKKSLDIKSFDSAEQIRALNKIGLQLDDMVSNSQGMDAATFTTPNVGAPIQHLQNWLPGFVKEVTTARKIDTLLGVTTVGNWHDEEIVQGVAERTAHVAEYGDFTNTPMSDYNTEFEKRTVVRFEDGYMGGTLARERAEAYGVDDYGMKRSASLIALEIVRNEVGFYGYNNGNNKTYGLLNDPNLPAYDDVATGDGGDTTWETKTYLEITADIIEAANTIRTQSGDNVDPYKDELRFVIASNSVGFLSTLNVQGTISVRKWIRDTFPNWVIESAPEFNEADGGENVFYLYAPSLKGDSSDNGRTFEQLVPSRLRTLGQEARAKGFTELFSNATAGVLCKRPYLVVRRSGI